MPPKKLKTKTGGNTPTQKSAANIARKYKACGKRMSPKRRERVRRALYNVSTNEQSIKKVVLEFLYSFLYQPVTLDNR